ncbi:NAD(P)-binding protein [Dothidotthia symphoricarpi CBS 119687]|uniref:NAD(P)-binding protein n=1 Tax=Dothidotthia symphoricarpi CBS 119687 TaxID=1392245 RepID=A0A6A6AEF8_9PLEO|nr:NAD(P)-binding protein [Dothidotthia symphoricarpi CBS 119687]KAF2129683.1 NAD(P)-binding protein [Dothidotthia symphoricarpi CBS 119687]
MAHANRLANKRVVVFGGTSGIGFGVANMALSNGATVIISGSRQPKVDDKVALMRTYYPSLAPGTVSGHALDLFDTANLDTGLKAFFDKVTHGGQEKINHIAFTAGDAFTQIPNIRTTNAGEVIDGFRVRYLAPLAIAKLLALHPDMYVANEYQSSFTLTGGTNTHKPMPGWSVGAGWGGAIEALARGLAVDLRPVRVNMVEPGAVQTELLQGYVEKLGPGGLEQLKKEAGLTGELGQPGDLAETFGWLMRDWFADGTIASSTGGRYLA